MMSLPVGTALIVWVLIKSMHGADAKVFLNEHSIILVIVGTLAILLMSTPMRILIDLFKALFHSGGGMPSKSTTNQKLLEVVADRENADAKGYPLIAHAQELWEAGVDPDVFSTLMAQRLDEVNEGSERAVAALKNLAKYPPAFGMIGTVIGMVALFGGLSGDNKDAIGPSLANAMTATFFGLILANAIISPLGDRMHIFHQAQVGINDHVFKVLMLIHRGYPETILRKELNGEKEA